MGILNDHQHLALGAPITIAPKGYIYIWVSNQSEATKVWFDDLTVSFSGTSVAQATDYGVWGDVLREQKTDDSFYRFGYQGQFSEMDTLTGWNHFELREYDPVIGRRNVTDPCGQYWNPYLGMGNNPNSNIDPNGGYSKLGARWRNALYGGYGIYQSGSDDGREVWGYNDDRGANFGKDARSFWQGFLSEGHDVYYGGGIGILDQPVVGPLNNNLPVSKKSVGLDNLLLAEMAFEGAKKGGKAGLLIVNKELAKQNLINNLLRKPGIQRSAFRAFTVPKPIRFVGKYGGFIFTAYGAYDINDQWSTGQISTGQMWIEQGSNLVGAIPLYGTAWSIGWELGKSYGSRNNE